MGHEVYYEFYLNKNSGSSFEHDFIIIFIIHRL